MYGTFQAFRPYFDAMARVGYFKVVLKPETKRQKKIHDFYRVLMWIAVVTYNVQHIVRAIKVRHQIDQLIGTMFLLLTTLNTLGKQLTFNFRVQRIDKIIETINNSWCGCDPIAYREPRAPFCVLYCCTSTAYELTPNFFLGPIFAPKNKEHDALIKANVKYMSRFLAVCHIGGLTCSAIYSVCLIIEKLLGHEVVLTASFPFDVSEFIPFLIANLYMGILISMQAYAHITMDCLIVAFYVCVKNQLQLFRYDLEHLTDDFKLRDRNLKYVDDDREYRKILHNKIVACVKHYDKIFWFSQEIQSIFNEATAMQFFVTTWVICTTAYKIVGVNMFLYIYMLRDKALCVKGPTTITTLQLPLFTPGFFSSIMYLCCIMGQLYIYCYFGTHLNDETGLVIDSIYRSDWLSMSPAFRRCLFILMERCKRKIEPRAASIIPMSLDTYISVLRSSYALFTILNRKE